MTDFLTGRVQGTEGLFGADDGAVALATAELVRLGLRPEGYRVSVLRERDAVTVIFLDATASGRGRGNSGLRTGVEVRLSADGSTVERTSFVR